MHITCGIEDAQMRLKESESEAGVNPYIIEDKEHPVKRCAGRIEATIYTLQVLFLMFACVSCAHAASVRGVSIEEMLLHSRLVFEGEVMESHSSKAANGMISTSITFTVIDTIKGGHLGDTLTLEFLGGTVGEITHMVSGLQLPRFGEHGIYFVEAPARKQINPLFGWSQGHFIAEKDSAGTDRVMTNRGIPLTGVMDILPKNSAGLSNGVARGVVTVDKQSTGSGMSTLEFKTSLHTIITRLQNEGKLESQP